MIVAPGPLSAAASTATSSFTWCGIDRTRKDTILDRKTVEAQQKGSDLALTNGLVLEPLPP